MPPFNVSKRLIDTSTWAATTDLAAIDLPREGIITGVRVRFTPTMDGATLATNQPDGLRRGVENLRIEGDGGRTYLSLAGEQTGRILGLLNEMEYGPLVTLLSAATESYSWYWHPGSNARHPFDLTAGIPARVLSTLQARVTTGAAADIDDVQVISSGTYFYSIDQVLGMPVPATLKVPLSITQTRVHDGNYSDFGYESDVPTGNYLRRLVILVQDETAVRPVRANDEVTAVRIHIPKLGRTIIEERWEDLKVKTALRYGVKGVQFQIADTATGHMSMPDGFAVIDFRDYDHPIYGLDLRDVKAGDLKLGLTVENYAAGDDTLLWYDMLSDVPRELVGK